MHDVSLLLQYERDNSDSVASRQVRAHWDKFKNLVSSDNHTKSLSNSLRSLQDMYLRILWELHVSGNTRFVATILKPEYALLDFEFTGLDSEKLTYVSVKEISAATKLRKSLASRIVRIAFDSLKEYVSKGVRNRNMVRRDFDEKFG